MGPYGAPEREKYMDNHSDNHSMVPFAAFEAAEERADRRDRRHWIGHIVELIIIIAMAAAFLLYLNQYDFSGTMEIQQDGKGINIVGDRNGGNCFGTESYGIEEAY